MMVLVMCACTPLFPLVSSLAHFVILFPVLLCVPSCPNVLSSAHFSSLFSLCMCPSLSCCVFLVNSLSFPCVSRLCPPSWLILFPSLLVVYVSHLAMPCFRKLTQSFFPGITPSAVPFCRASLACLSRQHQHEAIYFHDPKLVPVTRCSPLR